MTTSQFYLKFSFLKIAIQVLCCWTDNSDSDQDISVRNRRVEASYQVDALICDMVHDASHFVRLLKADLLPKSAASVRIPGTTGPST